MKILSLIKAYWGLLFPSVPDSIFSLSAEKTRLIVKEKARGNPSLQVGNYTTKNKRKERKENICGHSFI